MAAKIIELSEYKSTIRSKRNGVAFPTIYRAQGYFYGEEGLAGARGEEGAVFYTLSKNDANGYRDVAYEPIRGFSEEDTGWLILRHHPNRDNVEGYLDAQCDSGIRNPSGGLSIFQTKEGLFSLLHRPAVPGCPDKLVVYVTRGPDPFVGNAFADTYGDGWMDHHQIVQVDGSLTEDPDIMLPPEPDDE